MSDSKTARKDAEDGRASSLAVAVLLDVLTLFGVVWLAFQLHTIDNKPPVVARVTIDMEVCKEASWYCPRKGMNILIRVCGTDREAVCAEFDAAVEEAMEDCPPSERGAAPSPLDGPGGGR